MSNQSDSETEDDLVSEENETIKNLVADELDGMDTWGTCTEEKQKEVKEIIINENLFVCDVLETHLKENKVSLMNVHTSKQAMMCIVESMQRNVKFFFSFIYASNSRRERQDLWAILQDHQTLPIINLGFKWETSMLLLKLVNILLGVLVNRTEY
nr:hypothetical protein [Tanacetum cinerariifolium]